MIQLDKLGSDKRKKVLDRLIAANVIDSELKMREKPTSTSPTKVSGRKSTEATQDEVEILDLHEPKMGAYKKKRSK